MTCNNLNTVMCSNNIELYYMISSKTLPLLFGTSKSIYCKNNKSNSFIPGPCTKPKISNKQVINSFIQKISFQNTIVHMFIFHWNHQKQLAHRNLLPPSAVSVFNPVSVYSIPCLILEQLPELRIHLQDITSIVT